MIPRADIVALEISTPLAAVAAQFIESEHSRLPIYRETLDDPVGFVHIKDVFKLIAGKMPPPAPDEAVLGRLRRETPLRAALDARRRPAGADAGAPHPPGHGDRRVRRRRRAGHAWRTSSRRWSARSTTSTTSPRPPRSSPAPDGVFEVDGRAELAEVEAAIGRELPMPDPDEEIDTIAGLVAAVAGRVPQRGEIVSLAPDLDAEIADADPRRIKRLPPQLIQQHHGSGDN